MEEIDELDVGRQQQLSCGHAAVVELGVEKFKLRQRTAHRHAHLLNFCYQMLQ